MICHSLVSNNRNKSFFIGKREVLVNVAVKTRLTWQHQCGRTSHDDFKILIRYFLEKVANFGGHSLTGFEVKQGAPNPPVYLGLIFFSAQLSWKVECIVRDHTMNCYRRKQLMVLKHVFS